MFGHLNIESLGNLSRFESVVNALLRKHESKLEQQQQQHDEPRKTRVSSRSRKKGGDARALVQCPRCDSPSTDEAEVSCSNVGCVIASCA